MVENWYFDESIYINYKTSDRCVLKFETDKKEIHRYEGYVPDFFPDKHYGDYIMLTISKKGLLKKFGVTDEQIDELLEGEETYVS